MITQVKMQLEILPPASTEPTPGTAKISQDFAYNIYGAWMELLDPAAADYLHNSHSVSQFLTINRLQRQVLKANTGVQTLTASAEQTHTAVHTVNLLTPEAIEYMLPFLQKTEQYTLTKHNRILLVKDVQIMEIPRNELFDRWFTSPQYANKFTLHFVSPATFKSHNQYAIFPTPELILQSAAAKFNRLGLEVTVEDREALAQLVENTMITNYKLHSTRYYLKDTRIQSFLGSVTLSIRGPEPMIRLFGMLMGALRYTGVGIKTALGMGGVEVT